MLHLVTPEPAWQVCYTIRSFFFFWGCRCCTSRCYGVSRRCCWLCEDICLGTVVLTDQTFHVDDITDFEWLIIYSDVCPGVGVNRPHHLGFAGINDAYLVSRLFCFSCRSFTFVEGIGGSSAKSRSFSRVERVHWTPQCRLEVTLDENNHLWGCNTRFNQPLARACWLLSGRGKVWAVQSLGPWLVGVGYVLLSIFCTGGQLSTRVSLGVRALPLDREDLAACQLGGVSNGR